MTMGSKNILIADNDEELRSLLAFFIAKMGFRVAVVNNGKSAVEEAQKGDFELVMLDVMMPELDGYHTAAEISEKMGNSRPKILIMTSRDLKTEHGIALMSGADASIQKPFKLSEVKTKIESILQL